MLQLRDVDLEDSGHESRDDGGNLIFEVVSAVKERLRGGNAVEDGQPN